jgi:hypothetical protein
MTAMMPRRIVILAGVAVLVTGLNAVKPAVVDDAAYLAFACHLVNVPCDPYGGVLFWYAYPQPTQEILLPPLLPYWLAGGIWLFGMNLCLLKLSLLPFLLILALSLDWLFRRLAPGPSCWLVSGILLGPAVLPMLNVMLDVPATALGMAAITLFIRSAETGRCWTWLVAGLMAGLAAQTKYTMLTLPGVILAFAVTHGAWRAMIVAISAMLLVFVGWELWMAAKYQTGHFLYHVREQQQYQESQLLAITPDPGLLDRCQFLIHSKWPLFQPMLGYLGWLGIGAGAVATVGLGLRVRWLILFLVTAVLGFVAVAVTPYSQAVLIWGRHPGSVRLDLPTAVFVTLGTVTALLTLAAAVRLFCPDRTRSSASLGCWNQEWRDSLFLMLWLLVEVTGYFLLTPFPAGRRVIVLAVVATLVAARSASYRSLRSKSDCPAIIIASLSAMLAGLLLFCCDFWDALPERAAARWAANRIALESGNSGTVWFHGHWGFQYYCEEAGMRPVIPGVSWLLPGDWLVYPKLPDDYGFYRPYHGGAKFRIDPDSVVWVDCWLWDDWLAGQTIPPLYGGRVPLTGRDHPRLTIELYRISRPWIPAPAR